MLSEDPIGRGAIAAAEVGIARCEYGLERCCVLLKILAVAVREFDIRDIVGSQQLEVNELLRMRHRQRLQQQRIDGEKMTRFAASPAASITMTTAEKSGDFSNARSD